ncbi:Palmitoyltransferase [Mycena chlorophos]|uniref:Palmitoyltransferase n=1 Tax=Mycena chlorophos TaxID=658473 RepID=A0A8H6VW86_MYCCL|nr:Palmitoyltransferase [Mycena chlorophos]
MFGARTVFRCFKALERLGDRITGAAGPFFVALAVILTTLGTACFFTILWASLPYRLLTTPLCILIALNMHGHYFLVTRIRPGFVDAAGPGLVTPAKGRIEDSAWLWAPRRRTARGWELELEMTRGATVKCRRCAIMRPERAHHCRISDRVLPSQWINQCVGLHNERHFVLFMAYLVIGATAFCFAGWDTMLHSLGFGERDPWNDWPHTIPQTLFLLTYLLAGVMSLAVGIMLSFHLRGIALGETSVEGHDNEVYRRVASQRGETFVNSYDLGSRRANLELVFNVGEGGEYGWWTILLPVRVRPYTDGWEWARRRGFSAGHGGCEEG